MSFSYTNIYENLYKLSISMGRILSILQSIYKAEYAEGNTVPKLREQEQNGFEIATIKLL